ncbi:hypothetical protein F5Y19DRAFT_477119 [Xylariaceae sp. FL1651]|nr:hypothetical protein F5Y19DRAFT_477119 [Xylariaceae sp. FL1651]
MSQGNMSTPQDIIHPRLYLAVEFEMLMFYPAVPAGSKFSDADWLKMAAPLREALNSVYFLTYISTTQELDTGFAHWRLRRGQARNDRTENQLFSLTVTSPMFCYFPGNKWREDLNIAYSVLASYRCLPSERSAISVYIAPVHWYGHSYMRSMSSFTLEAAKSIAGAILRHTYGLMNVAIQFSEGRWGGFTTPWPIDADDKVIRVQNRIAAAQSFQDLIACMHPEPRNPNHAQQERQDRMWDFSSLIRDSGGTVKCTLGSGCQSVTHAAMWIHFACLFILRATASDGFLASTTQNRKLAKDEELVQLFFGPNQSHQGLPGHPEMTPAQIIQQKFWELVNQQYEVPLGS